MNQSSNAVFLNTPFGLESKPTVMIPVEWPDQVSEQPNKSISHNTDSYQLITLAGLDVAKTKIIVKDRKREKNEVERDKRTVSK